MATQTAVTALRLACAILLGLGTAIATAAPPENEPALAPAWRAYREGRALEAREQLASQPAAIRESPAGLLLGGLLALSDGRAEEAEQAFARVPLEHPLGLAARYNRALALLELDRADEAVRSARALVAALPELPAERHEAAAAALYNTAMALLSRGHPRSARRLFGLIAERLPATEAARSAGEMLAARGSTETPPIETCVQQYRSKEYADARACFAELVEAHGPNAEMLYAIAYADYQLGEYERAAAELERVLVVDPRDGDALFMLAMARAHMGQHRAALRLFQDALAVGLVAEDPGEARRHIRTLSKLLQQRRQRGWAIDADAAAGYDSNPRPMGGAAAASTSYGADVEGSGFADLQLGAEYRWPHPSRRGGALGGLTALGYHFTQYLLFSDLASDVAHGSGRPRWQDTFSDLSLQTHTAYLYTSLPRGSWTGRLRASGSVELSGLREFGPLLASGHASPEAEYAWGGRSSSRVAAGFLPQRSLDQDLDYLSGYGLFAEVAQLARWGSAVELSVSYRATAWWLGTFEQSATECTGDEPCALSVPYSNHLHRPAIALAFTAPSGLAIRAEAAIERRVYWNEGVYRLASGAQVVEERRDLATCAELSVRVPVDTHTRLILGLDYTRNRSTIDEETAEIDEGYDRFAVSAALSYRK